MLSDKQIQEISNAAFDYAGYRKAHPFICLTAFTSILPYDQDERNQIREKCKQWLFDNQESYPFSITKQDMIY